MDALSTGLSTGPMSLSSAVSREEEAAGLTADDDDREEEAAEAEEELAEALRAGGGTAFACLKLVTLGLQAQIDSFAAKKCVEGAVEAALLPTAPLPPFDLAAGPSAVQGAVAAFKNFYDGHGYNIFGREHLDNVGENGRVQARLFVLGFPVNPDHPLLAPRVRGLCRAAAGPALRLARFERADPPPPSSPAQGDRIAGSLVPFLLFLNSIGCFADDGLPAIIVDIHPQHAAWDAGGTLDGAQMRAAAEVVANLPFEGEVTSLGAHASDQLRARDGANGQCRPHRGSEYGRRMDHYVYYCGHNLVLQLPHPQLILARTAGPNAALVAAAEYDGLANRMYTREHAVGRPAGRGRSAVQLYAEMHAGDLSKEQAMLRLVLELRHQEMGASSSPTPFDDLPAAIACFLEVASLGAEYWARPGTEAEPRRHGTPLAAALVLLSASSPTHMRQAEILAMAEGGGPTPFAELSPHVKSALEAAGLGAAHWPPEAMSAAAGAPGATPLAAYCSAAAADAAAVNPSGQRQAEKLRMAAGGGPTPFAELSPHVKSALEAAGLGAAHWPPEAMFAAAGAPGAAGHPADQETPLLAYARIIAGNAGRASLGASKRKGNQRRPTNSGRIAKGTPTVAHRCFKCEAKFSSRAGTKKPRHQPGGGGKHCGRCVGGENCTGCWHE